MLGKNNKKELLKREANRLQTFSIKKLSVGVASILVATSLFFVGNSASVNAEEAGSKTFFEEKNEIDYKLSVHTSYNESYQISLGFHSEPYYAELKARNYINETYGENFEWSFDFNTGVFTASQPVEKQAYGLNVQLANGESYFVSLDFHTSANNAEWAARNFINEQYQKSFNWAYDDTNLVFTASEIMVEEVQEDTLQSYQLEAIAMIESLQSLSQERKESYINRINEATHEIEIYDLLGIAKYEALTNEQRVQLDKEKQSEQESKETTDQTDKEEATSKPEKTEDTEQPTEKEGTDQVTESELGEDKEARDQTPSPEAPLSETEKPAEKEGTEQAPESELGEDKEEKDQTPSPEAPLSETEKPAEKERTEQVPESELGENKEEKDQMPSPEAPPSETEKPAEKEGTEQAPESELGEDKEEKDQTPSPEAPPSETEKPAEKEVTEQASESEPSEDKEESDQEVATPSTSEEVEKDSVEESDESSSEGDSEFRGVIDVEGETNDSLDELKEDVINQIDEIEHLSQHDKEMFKTRVVMTEDKAEVNRILAEAKEKSESNRKQKEIDQLQLDKLDAYKKVNALNWLDSTSKSNYIIQIGLSESSKEVYDLLDAAERENNLGLQKALNEAKEKAVHDVNALEYLSPRRKAAFIQNMLSETETPNYIYHLARLAKVEDDALRLSELVALKVSVEETIDQLDLLTQEHKLGFKEQLSEASDKDAVNQVLTDAKAEQARLEAEALRLAQLEKAKETAKAMIAGLAHLTQDEKEGYQAKLPALEEVEAVNRVVADAQATNQANKERKEAAEAALREAKTQALAELSNLDLLPIEYKTSVATAINEAEDVEAVDKQLVNAREEQARLEAKETAKATIAGLEHLTQGEKTSYQDDISQAEEVEAVNRVVADAQSTNQANKERKEAAEAALREAKTQALAELSNLDLLPSEYKTSVATAINEADSVESIGEQLVNAKAEQARLEAEALRLVQLEEAKRTAQATIAGLEHLTQDEKEGYQAKLPALEKVEAVNGVLAEAQATNQANKERKEAVEAELQRAKAQALEALTTLDLLSSEYKSSVETAINEAEDVEAVDQQLVNAKAEQARLVAEALSLAQLEEAKETAKATIAGLEHLTQDEKEGYQAKLLPLEEVEAVNRVVADAQSTNQANKERKEAVEAELQRAKAQALEALTTLDLLSSEYKSSVETAINEAEDVEAVDQQLVNAKAEQARLEQAAIQWSYDEGNQTWYKRNHKDEVLEYANATGYFVGGEQVYDYFLEIDQDKRFYFKPAKYDGKQTIKQWAYSATKDTWYEANAEGVVTKEVTKEGYLVYGNRQFDALVKVGNGTSVFRYYKRDGSLLINDVIYSETYKEWFRSNEKGEIIERSKTELK